MESSGEGGEGGSGLGFSEIETKSEALARAEVFHIVKEVIGFVLFMHSQIPVYALYSLCLSQTHSLTHTHLT